MCGACKPPISATARISVLYLFSLHVFCLHLSTLLFPCFLYSCCKKISPTAIIVILPLYLILLQIGPMAEHCLILETIWMWLSTVLCHSLDIIRIVILHSLDELEIPCFSLNQLWLDGNTLFCEAPHSRSPRTITMLQGNRPHCPASTSYLISKNRVLTSGGLLLAVIS